MNDAKSERCYRIIDVEKGFVTKITADSHEYTLEVEGVEHIVAPNIDLEALDEEFKKVTVSEPIKM